MGPDDKTKPAHANPRTDEALAIIGQALGWNRYGAIQLTVHDGKVTQLDVTERRRFGA